MRFRYTIKELHTMTDKDLLLSIINERQSDCTNIYAPLYKRLNSLRENVKKETITGVVMPEARVYSLCEAVADITQVATRNGFYSGNFRADINSYIEWAHEFEKKYEGIEWGVTDERDYVEAIRDFTLIKMAEIDPLFKCYKEAGNYLCNDDNVKEAINAIIEEYNHGQPDSLIDDIEIVEVSEKVQFQFTVKEFLFTIGYFEVNS